MAQILRLHHHVIAKPAYEATESALTPSHCTTRTVPASKFESLPWWIARPASWMPLMEPFMWGACRKALLQQYCREIYESFGHLHLRLWLQTHP